MTFTQCIWMYLHGAKMFGLLIWTSFLHADPFTKLAVVFLIASSIFVLHQFFGRWKDLSIASGALAAIFIVTMVLGASYTALNVPLQNYGWGDNLGIAGYSTAITNTLKLK